MVKRIGKYEILGSLGQGAMGEVLLAYHPVLEREVAIKTILGAAGLGPEAEERFRREAAAAGRLSHPNLVSVFDFDRDGETLFLVMEYVKGRDLEELIRERALDPAQCLEVLAQVCDGLAHAHRNGVVHRDVKPGNVRVIQEGGGLLAKVMDFGIARLEDSTLTSTGVVMGTVSYMAPEYIRDGRATPQSDLFAVGVMLYECLTGHRPFAGDTTGTILYRILSTPAEPPAADALAGLGPGIRRVLDRALAKDPAGRYPDAETLARALRACLDPAWTGESEPPAPVAPTRNAGVEGTLARLPAGSEPTRALAAPVARRSWRPALLAGALAVAGVASVLALRSRPAPAPGAPAPAAGAPAPAPAGTSVRTVPARAGSPENSPRKAREGRRVRTAVHTEASEVESAGDNRR